MRNQDLLELVAISAYVGRGAPRHCRRRFLMIGALPLQPPPPIICWRAADATLLCLIILLHFSSFGGFWYKWLPQCEIEVDSSRQQFVPMSGLQNLILKTNFKKSPNSLKSGNFLSNGFCADHHSRVL